MNRPQIDSTESQRGVAPIIYVVDDEPMLLELATVILSPLGYVIHTFRNAEAALEAYVAAQPRPNLIITDYAMHAMSGLTLIDECRRLHPGQKAVLVSGTVNEEVYRHTSCKPDRFLAKPYQARHLIDAVESLLAAEAH
jgi:CheY-like chemotaxis protein